MSFLARFKVITKFLAVILLMSAIAGTVAFVGIDAMKSMNEQAIQMVGAANRSLEAARLNQNVLALNRANSERRWTHAMKIARLRAKSSMTS